MGLKKNCWELKDCGRQPMGSKVSELGVCSAATDRSANGLNGGQNGGRICWAIAGTLCGGKVQGTFTDKQFSCMTCDVYKLIQVEEGNKFVSLKPAKTGASAPSR